MWIFTNSPNTPDYITPGKLYKVAGRIFGRIIIDDDGDLIMHEFQSVHWHALSDYHAKHLTD